MLSAFKRLFIGSTALLLAFSGSAEAQQNAGITVRAPDAFYDTPRNAPHNPGALLRSEPLHDVTLPAGMRGWRILYTTSINDRTRAIAVATVFAPIRAPAGPRPVIAWAHATTGLVQRCMPSLLSSPAEGIPGRGRIAGAGWVIVATDYSFAEKNGPHPYLIGEGEARAVLDAVRAARRMPELTLDARTVVWGHSQGGHAALWTGIVAPHYAPDVNLVGVAAIAPVANLVDIATLNPSVDKATGPYVARAYSRFYPDVRFEDAVRPEALTAAREMAGLCGFAPPEDTQRLGVLATSFSGPVLAINSAPALVARVIENNAVKPIAAPLLIAQGARDDVVPFPATDTYVEDLCEIGQRLDYWKFWSFNHGTIIEPDSRFTSMLMNWTRARFAGQPQANGCRRRSF